MQVSDKKVLVIMRKAPYGSIYSTEGFRSVMGIGVFEMDVSIALVDDGVSVALEGQDPSKLEMSALGELFLSLDEFGVHKLYVHEQSLTERGFSPEDLVMPFELIDAPRLNELIENSDTILTF